MEKARSALGPMLCGLFALLLTVTWIRPAYAWTWNRDHTVYKGPGLCVRGSAGIDHRQSGVFSGNLAYASTRALDGKCRSSLTKPSDSAAVRLDVYKWNGSAWTLCRRTDWRYGPTGVSGGDTGSPYGPDQILDYGGSSACGPGYYGTMAHAYVWDGSAWRGGSIWSGYENVP